MESRTAIVDLLTAYLNKQVSREEFDRLFSALASLEDDEFKETILQMLDSESDLIDADFIQQRVSLLYPTLQAKIQLGLSLHATEPIGASEKKRRIWWRVPAVAAALLALLLIGLYLIPGRFHQNESVAVLTPEQILPGGNRAVLMLSDGRRVDLSAEKGGVVVKNGIKYADGSAVISQPMDNSTIGQARLSTPNGGQYQITLPDGTHVWLNAASTLTYPIEFSGSTREVVLAGEAYFEVVKNGAKPFVVHTAKQRTEVLGTSFNINAYGNETVTKTTLVTGALRVNATINNHTNEQSLILTPNQQSIVGDNGNEIKVNQVNPQLATAWKNGLFNFHGLSIDESLKQIERWYDIDIAYRGSKPKGYLGGKMSRGVKLSTFLEFLEKDFNIQSELKADRTLILYTKKH